MIPIDENFLKEETRLDYRISPEMKGVWAVSMDLAQKLVEVCERNGLKCWMDSGTLLGAVRHKGFIPWDDDIDFVMLRKDYDKLVKIADKEFTHPYFFQTTYSDEDYYRGHAQLRNVETTSFDQTEIDKDFCRGIDVDIFVLDGFIENPLLRFLHRTSTMLIKKSLRGYLSHSDEKLSFGKKIIAVVSKFIYKFVDYRKAFAFYEDMFRKVDEDTHKRVSVSSYKYSNRRRIRNKKSYDDTVWLQFEWLKFPAPVDCEDALVCYFGKDYMNPQHLPTAHGRKYMDANQDYKSAAELLRKNPDLYQKRIDLLYTD